MKRVTVLLAVSMLILGAVACQESRVTGTVGTASVKGKVVMSGDLTNVDPSGIEVRVPGTGITTVTNADGVFLISGVREGELDLVLLRGDGIDEVRTVSTKSDSVTIELTGRRGRGRPVAKPGYSIQGSIIEVRESSILVDSVRDGEVEVFVDEDTFIYKGSVTLLPGDLQVDEMIHARAHENDEGEWVAQTIAVSPRHGGNTDFLPRSAVGEIVSIGENQLTVLTEDGIEVLVNIDERTEIYTKNILLELEDLEVGDRVKVFGVKLEDGSLLASWIRVKPAGGDDEEGDEGEEDDLGNAVHGEVISTGENTLVVLDGDGHEVTVEVDDSTEIKKRGKTISFEEIAAGNFVTAIGERIDETTLEARKINVTK